ncbi:MAG: ferritin-like domain-containing protein [Acidimicrobiales bacterium]
MEANRLLDDAYIDSVLAVVGRQPTSTTHAVVDAAPAQFTWDYDKGARPPLTRLYEKAKGAQWNGATDLPWDTDVDPEQLAVLATAAMRPMTGPDMVKGTPFEGWGDAEWIRYGVESQRWMLSQFLHGEQGALLATAKIVETVPWIDAKYYAATQVMDEARHVEVFARYLQDKLEGGYPVNAHLGALLYDVVADARWDITYLGMQIIVEGLALAAFGMMHAVTQEPLLKQLLRYVMADEARHVAFGVLSLKEVYDGLSASEIRERQEFAYEASVRMRDRFLQQEIWERMGLDVRRTVKLMAGNPGQAIYRQILFSKIVPNLKKLGLLDAGAKPGEQGWLRQRFGELGVLQFEEAVDTSIEYADLAIAAR